MSREGHPIRALLTMNAKALELRCLGWLRWVSPVHIYPSNSAECRMEERVEGRAVTTSLNRALQVKRVLIMACFKGSPIDNILYTRAVDVM